MPFCQHCGTEYQEGAEFCPSCGQPVEDTRKPQPNLSEQTKQDNQQQPSDKQQEKKKKAKKGCYWGCLFVIVIILLIIVIPLISSHCSEKKYDKLVKVKEVTGAKCIGCGVVFDADTIETQKRYIEVHDNKYVYNYRDTVCAECEKKFAEEAKALFAEGKRFYNSGKYREAKGKFAAAKAKGHKQAEEWRKKADDKIREAEKRAKAKAGSDTRKGYAGLARNAFLDQGMDVKVRVHGPNNTYITLTNVLIGEVWVHNFKKSAMFREMRELGFERIYYKDGYDYSTYTYWK